MKNVSRLDNGGPRQALPTWKTPVLTEKLPWQTERIPNGLWKDRELRIEATRWLLRVTKKRPEEITVRDFDENGLHGVLVRCGTSPYLALKEAEVFSPDFKPWMVGTHVPNGFWKSKENRIDAVKWLLEKTGKKPEEIDTLDLRSNNLHGLLMHHRGSTFAILAEAGVLSSDFMPWQSSMHLPNNYWDEKETRVAAINWLLKETKKRPEELIGDDFEAHSISGALRIFKYSVYATLLDAGLLPPGFKPWQMAGGTPKGYWDSADHRKDAVMWLLKRTGKIPETLTGSDFKENSLVGLFSRVYRNSVLAALIDTDIAPQELMPWQMDIGVPQRYWKVKENRVRAVRWLVDVLTKEGKIHDYTDISTKHFHDKKLGGMLSAFYHGSAFAALLETGVASSDTLPWLMKMGVPNKYWGGRENRKKAAVWLFNKLKSEKRITAPEELNRNHFLEFRLSGFLGYYKGSIYSLLVDTGLVPQDFKPWAMNTHVPNSFWSSKENRVGAVKWLIDKLMKEGKISDIRQVKKPQFVENGLSGISNGSKARYSNFVYDALNEAGLLPPGLKMWEMESGVSKRFWNKKENRIDAVLWLVKVSGKRPEEIGRGDFQRHNLLGLLSRYKSSVFLALREAGIVVDQDSLDESKRRSMTNESFNQTVLDAMQKFIKETRE